MKKVKVPKKVQTIFGRPFRIIDYNQQTREGEEQKFIEGASVTDLLTLMVYGIPRDKLTMKDSIEAGRFMEQLRSSKNGILELEEAEHDWIKKVVEDHGTSVYGVNASILKNILEDFERLHEPQEKKGKEGKVD